MFKFFILLFKCLYEQYLFLLVSMYLFYVNLVLFSDVMLDCNFRGKIILLW